MAKLIWAVLCRRIILDAGTNLISYVDALDGLILPKYPMPAPPIYLGTIWQREQEKRIEMRATVLDPNEKKLAAVIAEPLLLESEHKRVRLNVGIAGFMIEAPGRYHFVVETKGKNGWEEVQRVPIDFEMPKAKSSAKKESPKRSPARSAR